MAKLIKITLYNEFHRTEMNIMADAEMIAEYADPWFELHLRATYNEDVAAGRRADRIRRTLCGHAGCTCKKVSYYEIA
jgi:hypothetical protein